MTRTWRLTNSSGGTEMVLGDMDLSFEDGRVVEIAEPILVLDQRFRKCSVEPRGSNPQAPGWGSTFHEYLGGKNFGRRTLRLVGQGIVEMADFLRQSQAELRRRLTLAPAERIADVTDITVSQDGARVGASARVVTEAGTSREIQIEEVPRAG